MVVVSNVSVGSSQVYSQVYSASMVILSSISVVVLSCVSVVIMSRVSVMVLSGVSVVDPFNV